MEKGYLQVYTGNGKGKTTAALGLALRAAGANLRVFFAQFIKRGEFSEINALRKLGDAITIRQYGSGSFIMSKPTEAQIEDAARGLTEISWVLSGGEYDVVILDEANSAVECGLFEIGTLLTALAGRHPRTEAVVTGRNAHQMLIDMADLVTEMKDVKHYFNNDVTARAGIEC